MVVRVYCDHCGNAAHNAKKFVYGSHNHFFGGCDPEPMPATAGLCGSQGQKYAQAQQNAMNQGYTILPTAPVERPQAGSVDLCDTCQIVWMNRVKALTQASEP